MDEKVEFENKLLKFGLNQFEVEIIYFLLEGKLRNAFNINNNIRVYPILNIVFIFRALSSLEKEGWIRSKKHTFLKYYYFIDKKTFQNKLDSIISKSRDVYQNQKDSYYSILDLVKKFEKQNKLKKPSEKVLKQISIFEVSENSPEFIKKFMKKISKYPNLLPFKSEINMVIYLKQNNIRFFLNSLEIEMKKGNQQLYGGFFFCSIDEKEFSQSILEEIHTYNSNGLKFLHKLESKGYIENKTRGITDFSYSESKINIEKKQIKTNFSIKILDNPVEGIIETSTYSENPLIIGTLWAESNEFLKIIKKHISL